ncbi:hypothetical protein OAN47_03720 [Planctomycetota bacterium]|nr:hypothetical protein [Planctomycetota bacterium]
METVKKKTIAALLLVIFSGVTCFGQVAENCSNGIDDDGGIDISDAITVLGYLFSGTGDPPAPFPECGGDPTADSLGCESHGGC